MLLKKIYIIKKMGLPGALSVNNVCRRGEGVSVWGERGGGEEIATNTDGDRGRQKITENK